MRRQSLIAGTLIVIVLAGLIAACNNPVSVLPTTPPSPTVSAVQVIGPDTLAPGQSAQFTALSRLSDGTTKAPASGTFVQWTASGGLQVSPSGVVTAPQQAGEGFVTAAIGTGSARRQSTRQIVIVPDGTYRVVGAVTEADFPAVPIIGARVEAFPGSIAATTDANGQYRLYGVPASATMTVTKAGYATLSQSVQLTAHVTRHFLLALVGPRLVLAGPYTLTLDATGNCGGSRPLASSLQRRTYDATLTQVGPDVTVSLTEARFRTNTRGFGNRFFGRADGAGATFYLAPFDAYYYYYDPTYHPSVAERLSDSSILTPYGSAVTSGSAAGLSGTMNGGLQLWDARFPAFNTNILSFCSSTAIHFALTPR